MRLSLRWRFLALRPLTFRLLTHIRLPSTRCWALWRSLVFTSFWSNLNPICLEESNNQTAYLETITGSTLSVAIAGSAALSLFLELAVIRWQGSIFEFFSFYKNYGLLACFAGLGLGYSLSRRDDGGILLNLTPALLVWQFGLLIFLRFGLLQSSESFATVPFENNSAWGCQLPHLRRIERSIFCLLSLFF